MYSCVREPDKLMKCPLIIAWVLWPQLWARFHWQERSGWCVLCLCLRWAWCKYIPPPFLCLPLCLTACFMVCITVVCYVCGWGHCLWYVCEQKCVCACISLLVTCVAVSRHLVYICVLLVLCLQSLTLCTFVFSTSSRWCRLWSGLNRSPWRSSMPSLGWVTSDLTSDHTVMCKGLAAIVKLDAFVSRWNDWAHP